MQFKNEIGLGSSLHSANTVTFGNLHQISLTLFVLFCGFVVLAVITLGADLIQYLSHESKVLCRGCFDESAKKITIKKSVFTNHETDCLRQKIEKLISLPQYSNFYTKQVHMQFELGGRNYYCVIVFTRKSNQTTFELL